jgi:hypothetical protein
MHHQFIILLLFIPFFFCILCLCLLLGVSACKSVVAAVNAISIVITILVVKLVVILVMGHDILFLPSTTKACRTITIMHF